MQIPDRTKGSDPYDAYDRGGNRKTRDVPSSLYATNDKDQVFSHDGLHRLSGFDKGTLASGGIASPVFEQDHNLDMLGNWTNLIEKTSGGTTTLNQTRYHNKAHEIAGNSGNPITESTGSAWIDPVYDANGNLTEGPMGGWSGNSSAETTKIKLVYDAWNRLVQVKDASNTLIATYEYDGRHFRIRKVAEGSPNVTFDYYYNEGWQLLEVRKDGDADPLKQFVWDLRYIDALVCRFRDHDTNGTLDDTYYYTNDANFNVTALVESDGLLDERYEYDPYGKVHVLNADFSDDKSGGDGKSDVDNLVLFQGLMLDVESGLFSNRRRVLHPLLGLFCQRDPLWYVDSLNLYAVQLLDPVNHVDPFGTQLDSVSASAAQAIAAVGAASLVLTQAIQSRDMDAIRSASQRLSNATRDMRDLIFGTLAGLASEEAVRIANTKSKQANAEVAIANEMVRQAETLLNQARDVANQKFDKSKQPCEWAKCVLGNLEKRITAARRRIKEHENKIADPKKHMERDDPDDPVAVLRAINDWKNHIIKQEKTIGFLEVAVSSARKTVEVLCKK